MARTRSVLAGALLASLALTGCTGGDDPKPTSSSNASASRTSTPGNGSKATVNKLGKEWKSADKKVTYTVDKVDVKTSKGGVRDRMCREGGREGFDRRLDARRRAGRMGGRSERQGRKEDRAGVPREGDRQGRQVCQGLDDVPRTEAVREAGRGQFRQLPLDDLTTDQTDGP